MIMILYMAGPTVVALLIALAMALFGRRAHLVLPKAVRRSTLLGMVLALGGVIALAAWPLYLWRLANLGEDPVLVVQLVRYLAPLVLTVVALIFMVVPAPASGPSGSAALAPRTLLTFTSRAWLACLAAVVAAAFAIALFAGLASNPDERGRYVMFTMHPAEGVSASTNIYGWWFSTPCLILIAIICMTVLIGVGSISRPALASESQRDAGQRAVRSSKIFSVATGGVLLHLSVTLQTLSGTASLSYSQTGWSEFGTSFAALGPVLQVAALLASIVGMVLWWSVLIGSLATRTHETSKAARP
ncbi:hypothetical protein CQ019_05620 [Arthrobacter sp. MYb229]|nr:hypothetical protein CQ019_05620 [Arthrobacter sp. MYb229]PRB53737.1 hypothetical protein CQ013_05620 [Arthrobacter sp. MYb216]